MNDSQPTFTDLFAGIRGIRFAFEAAGCRCVFSSEWDKFAVQTYLAFHGEEPAGDITSIPGNAIPDHDILTGGFPCPPFSLAGVSKKNSMGRDHGFRDPAQGTLFFEIKRILVEKQPVAFLLENVKHLRNHDQGRTLAIICESLRDAGYDLEDRIIDSAGWVPQHRERIYLVGFRSDLGLGGQLQSVFPSPPTSRETCLADLLETPSEIASRHGGKYTLGMGTWRALKRHRERHERAGNGFGYGLQKLLLKDVPAVVLKSFGGWLKAVWSMYLSTVRVRESHVEDWQLGF